MSEIRKQSDVSLPSRRARFWRWLPVLAASALLHLFALEWANGVISVPNLHDDAIKTVEVQLRPPVLPAPPVPAAHKPISKPRPHPIAKAKPPVPPPSLPPIEPVQNATGPALAQDTPADTDSTTAMEDNKAAPKPVEDPTPPVADADKQPDTPPEKPEQPQFKVALPPPTEVNYDVKSVSEKSGTYYGSGSISWQVSDGGYQVTGKVGMLFFTLLNFSSEGKIDEYGIAPVLYSEKTRTRSETNTHFNRDERQSISFSASTNSYPLTGGAQDRGSVLWELAGMGRGDPEKFVAGAQFDLFVAGIRDGDIWSILVVGQEEIDTGNGKTMAWHVVRTPRAGTYDKKIDIWLAPQFQWSPVRIRYTEKNGDYMDMSMTSFHPLLAADTSNVPAH